MDKNTYIRGCEQPKSLRQGVFCNRHMEGKEFCYYEASEGGLERVCAKCCLNDYCNNDLLRVCLNDSVCELMLLLVFADSLRAALGS